MHRKSYLFLAICALLLLGVGGCSKRAAQVPVTSDETYGEAPGDRPGTSQPGLASGDGSTSPDGRFLAADGGFSVVFPEKPLDKFTSRGGLTTRTYSVEKDGNLFAVGVSQLADDVKKQLAGAAADGRLRIMNDQFDRARDAAIGSGRFRSEQRLDLPQFPDLVCDFQFEPAEHKASRQRLYLANDRLYAVIASGDKDFIISDDADRFFASFKLIDKSAPQKKE